MHFRVRKHVIQLIRTNYEPEKKGAKNVIIGKVRHANPVLSDDLRRQLTLDEIVEFETWLSSQHHAAELRTELAALQLPEAMSEAAEWFKQEGDSEIARSVAANIIANWQPLRYMFLKNGLLD